MRSGSPLPRPRSAALDVHQAPERGLRLPCPHPLLTGCAIVKQLSVLSLCFVALLATAAPLQTGESLPAMKLTDQHEKPVAFTRDTRIIFFAAEMAASRMMTQALEGLPASTLKDRNAIYIADISTMPAPISTFVAVPRMQKLPYSVALLRYALEGSQLPTKAGAVTALRIDDGRISAVEYPQNAQDIGRYLK
jgi:hypothetical protein